MRSNVASANAWQNNQKQNFTTNPVQAISDMVAEASKTLSRIRDYSFSRRAKAIQNAVVKMQRNHPDYDAATISAELQSSFGSHATQEVCEKYMFAPQFRDGAMCVVGEVFANSPATLAGLRAGDVIVKMGGLTGKHYFSMETTGAESHLITH